MSHNPATCPRCGLSALYGIEDRCRACNSPASDRAPNVVVAQQQEPAFSARLQNAQERCDHSGTRATFDLLIEIGSKMSAVVSTQPRFIVPFLSNDKSLYSSYHMLVDAGARAPADPQDDSRRSVVDSALYGNYGREISFAALSTDEIGLPSYGCVHMKLRENTVEFRATVLEENSFSFVERKWNPGTPSLPQGYLVEWSKRGSLGAVKLADRIAAGAELEELKGLLKQVGTDRDSDEILEVHVFGSFNRQAVEELTISPVDGLDEGDQLLVDAILKNWARGGTSGS